MRKRKVRPSTKWGGVTIVVVEEDYLGFKKAIAEFKPSKIILMRHARFQFFFSAVKAGSVSPRPHNIEIVPYDKGFDQ